MAGGGKRHLWTGAIYYVIRSCAFFSFSSLLCFSFIFSSTVQTNGINGLGLVHWCLHKFGPMNHSLTSSLETDSICWTPFFTFHIPYFLELFCYHHLISYNNTAHSHRRKSPQMFILLLLYVVNGCTTVRIHSFVVDSPTIQPMCVCVCVFYIFIVRLFHFKDS